MADKDSDNERDRIASLEQRTVEILQLLKLGQERMNSLQEVVARLDDNEHHRIATLEQRTVEIWRTIKVGQERLNTLQKVVARVGRPAYQAIPIETPLTNDDIIQIAKLALGDDVVLAKIKQAPAAFDVNPDDLGKLKAAGLSAKVIAAMLEKATLPPPSWPAYTPASEGEYAAQPVADATGVVTRVELAFESATGLDQVGALVRLGSNREHRPIKIGERNAQSCERSLGFKVDKGWKGVDVVLTRYPEPQPSGASSTFHARTEANGQFAFPALPAGDYILTTTPPTETARNFVGKKGLNAVNVKFARVSIDGAVSGPMTFGWNFKARNPVPVVVKSDGVHPFTGRIIIRSKSNIANN